MKEGRPSDLDAQLDAHAPEAEARRPRGKIGHRPRTAQWQAELVQRKLLTMMGGNAPAPAPVQRARTAGPAPDRAATEHAWNELWAINMGHVTDLAGAVQRKDEPGASSRAPTDDETHALAAAGVAGGGGALPHAATIKHAFGPAHDATIDSIRAHVGGAAATAATAIGATAYATGTSIAFADSPDLHTAAHEAAHVIQQQEGVHLAGGVGAAGDVYEQHADAVADAVVRGESAESKFVRELHGASGPVIQRKAAAKATAAQHDVPSTLSKFTSVNNLVDHVYERIAIAVGEEMDLIQASKDHDGPSLWESLLMSALTTVLAIIGEASFDAIAKGILQWLGRAEIATDNFVGYLINQGLTSALKAPFGVTRRGLSGAATSDGGSVGGRVGAQEGTSTSKPLHSPENRIDLAIMYKARVLAALSDQKETFKNGIDIDGWLADQPPEKVAALTNKIDEPTNMQSAEERALKGVILGWMNLRAEVAERGARPHAPGGIAVLPGMVDLYLATDAHRGAYSRNTNFMLYSALVQIEFHAFETFQRVDVPFRDLPVHRRIFIDEAPALFVDSEQAPTVLLPQLLAALISGTPVTAEALARDEIPPDPAPEHATNEERSAVGAQDAHATMSRTSLLLLAPQGARRILDHLAADSPLSIGGKMQRHDGE